MKFLELYVSVMFSWLANYYIGKAIFFLKEKPNKLKLFILIVLFALLLVFIDYYFFEFLHGVFKILVSYITLCIFYKLIFEEDMSTILVSCLVLYLGFTVSEIILASLISLILPMLSHSSLAFLKNTMIINVLNTLISYTILKLSNKRVTALIKNNKFNNIGSLCIILLLLITIALLIFKIPVSDWNFNSEFIVTMIILFCSCILGIFLVKQKSDIQRTTSMYQKLADYSDVTNNLLEDYRIISHEQKNQLLIIRSMIDESNRELVDYVDNLLDKRIGMKYEWIGQLNYLPLSGLKGLINYKLIEMEKSKIATNISISKEITKARLNKLSTKQKDNLYSIIGIYLDNAIQAAIESKEKEISLEIYKEKKDIVFVLANTYKGTVELDKVEIYGYSTKGKNHGVGLNIVKKIIEEEPIFSQTRNLYEEYYIQELRIHLDKIKKK